MSGEAIRAWIEGVGTTGLEKAAAFVRDGKVYKGYLQYEEIEDRFKGHSLAKQAKTAAKELKKDKAHALEIKASEKFEKIKKEMAGERKAEDKLKCRVSVRDRALIVKDLWVDCQRVHRRNARN